VQHRPHFIARHLVEHHHIKALVVACNTATAAAIHELRAQYPHLPLIGVEPALKPAIALSRTRRIGVIGTRGTLGSEKFQRLLNSLQGQAEFVVQPCNGLALAIEDSTHATHSAQACEKITQLLRDYTQQMGEFGQAAGQMDTLVLGCTHYIFAHQALQSLLGNDVQLVSTGEPVARQTRRLLDAAGQLRTGPAPFAAAARIQLLTNGELSSLQAAAQRWLHLPHSACHKAEPQV
jgi:glutamate racemase